MWKKVEIEELNRSVGGSGNPTNPSSLDFAISAQTQTKDVFLQLAYLVRAIVVDHAFEDYNKRTAALVLITTFEILKFAYDPYAVDSLVERVARKKIKSVKTLRSMIRDVVR